MIVVLSSHPGVVFGQAPPRRSYNADVLPISGFPAGRFGHHDQKQTTPDRRGGSTLNGSIQIHGAFQGSTPTGLATPEPLPLNLDEADPTRARLQPWDHWRTEIERNAEPPSATRAREIIA